MGCEIVWEKELKMLENLYTTKMSANKKALQNRFTKIRRKGGHVSKIVAAVMSCAVAAAMLGGAVVMAALNNEGMREEITLYSNGETVELENKPFIRENITYFPLREIFEKLGVFKIEGNEIVWDNGTVYIKVAEASGEEAVRYTIKIGSDSIGVKHLKDRLTANTGVSLTLRKPKEMPLLVGDKIYVPYTYIDYMLNRGLGIRNKTDTFDFMFTVNGEAATAFLSQGFGWPCDGDISSHFGERKNPATNKVIKHNGIDIAVPEGTDVKSAIYGTVTETGYSAEKGYFVIIERDNIQTVYAGLTQDIQVKKGDETVRGQNIGKVGKTGTSTGPHLHFEVLINGEYFNPESIG